MPYYMFKVECMRLMGLPALAFADGYLAIQHRIGLVLEQSIYRSAPRIVAHEQKLDSIFRIYCFLACFHNTIGDQSSSCVIMNGMTKASLRVNLVVKRISHVTTAKDIGSFQLAT